MTNTLNFPELYLCEKVNSLINKKEFDEEVYLVKSVIYD